MRNSNSLKSLLIVFFMLTLFVGCEKDPLNNYPEYEEPKDEYIGTNTLITIEEGCDTLNVDKVALYIKTPSGEVIKRYGVHSRHGEVSKFELYHGLKEGGYQVLYVEYETTDEDGKRVSEELGLGCRITFRGGVMHMVSEWNDDFEMFSSGSDIDTLYVASIDNIVKIVSMSNDVRYNREFTDSIYFLQLRDIDGQKLSKTVSREYGWLPIGYDEALPFRGTYDGGNHTISGLWVNREYMAPVGFIGYSQGAHICNLKLDGLDFLGGMAVGGVVGVAVSGGGERQMTFINNCEVKNSQIKGYDNSYGVGGILGIVDYQSAAHVNGSKSTDNSIYASSHAGGVVGAGARTSSLITYLCENSSDVTSQYNSCGGIVAQCDTLLAGGCKNYGRIKGAVDFVSKNKEQGISNVGCGGIAGGTGVALLSGCMNMGEITGKSGVGGIIGSARFTGGDPDDEGYMYNNVAIHKCANYASVTGDEFVGGLCGEAQVGIFGGYNEGNIVSHTKYAAGIVGNGALAVIYNSLNKGYVYAADSFAAGIVAMSASGTIIANQNYGDIEAANTHAAGIIGIAGNRMTVSYCTNFGDIYQTDYTRALTVAEYFAGIGGEFGDPNDWTAAEIASLVYASVEIVVGIAGIPFAALDVCNVAGKAVWSFLSTASTIFGIGTIFIDGGIWCYNIYEKVLAEDLRKKQENDYKELLKECEKVDNSISAARDFEFTAPGGFSDAVASKEHNRRVSELIEYLTVSEDNAKDFDQQVNQEQYDRMETLNDQALAKDVTHSVLSGIFIAVSAAGAVISIVASGGAAAPIIAGAVVGGIGAVLGGANSIWETTTTYVDNCDMVSQNSNYGSLYVNEGSTKIGGIVGVAQENVIIEDCINAGKGIGGGHIAGEAYHQANIKRCLSIADEQDWNGRIVASKDNNATTESLYYYSKSDTENISYATGLTMSEIQNKESFSGWDFDSEDGQWYIPSGTDNPYPIPYKSRFATIK